MKSFGLGWQIKLMGGLESSVFNKDKIWKFKQESSVETVVPGLRAMDTLNRFAVLTI